jgi:hypothetical protein
MLFFSSIALQPPSVILVFVGVSRPAANQGTSRREPRCGRAGNAGYIMTVQLSSYKLKSNDIENQKCAGFRLEMNEKTGFNRGDGNDWRFDFPDWWKCL